VLSNTTIEGLHTLGSRPWPPASSKQREQPDYAASRLRGPPRPARRPGASSPGATGDSHACSVKRSSSCRGDRDIDFRRPAGSSARRCCTSPSATGCQHQAVLIVGPDRGRKDIPRLRSRALRIRHGTRRSTCRAHGCRRARNRTRGWPAVTVMASWHALTSSSSMIS